MQLTMEETDHRNAWNVGFSSREITKEVKVSESTAGFRYSEPGGNSDMRRSGRQKATHESEDKFLRVNSLCDRQLTGQGRVGVRKPLFRHQPLDHWRLEEGMMDRLIKMWNLQFVTQDLCSPLSRQKNTSTVWHHHQHRGGNNFRFGFTLKNKSLNRPKNLTLNHTHTFLYLYLGEDLYRHNVLPSSQP